MKGLLSLLFALVWPFMATATNLASGEWFLDEDPGIGAGTSFAVDASPTATTTVTIPAETLNTLPPGFHLLGIRMLDSEGEWGHVVWRGFHIEEALPPTRLLAGAEWFIDEDPGVGQGAAITMPATPTGTVTPQVPAATLNALADGYHLIGVRTRDNMSRWGPVVWRGFHIDRSPQPAPQIASVDYQILREGEVVASGSRAAEPAAAAVTWAVDHGRTALVAGTSYVLQVTPKDVTGRAGHAVYTDFTYQPYASELALSAGALPGFFPSTTDYALTVANSVTSTTVTATLANPATTVMVNGSEVASGVASTPIPLAVGANTITVEVTAEDGTTVTTYTIVVTREASRVSSLGGLSLSAGTLSPGFAAGTTAYQVAASNTVSTIRVTPTVAEGTATVRVNGNAVASGAASAAIPLALGANTITVEVTAGDGTSTTTYTIVVTRAPSSDASLRALAVSAGSLSPRFAAGTTAYTISVGNSVTGFKVTPAVKEATAMVRINGTAVGSGAASATIPLAVGANAIRVEVTAGDGVTSRIYTVTVTRKASSNATLKKLVLQGAKLSPAFAEKKFGYRTTVKAGQKSLQIKVWIADPTAKIRIAGKRVKSGELSPPVKLQKKGKTDIKIVVTAQDGSEKTYRVTVTKLAAKTGKTNLPEDP